MLFYVGLESLVIMEQFKHLQAIQDLWWLRKCCCNQHTGVAVSIMSFCCSVCSRTSLVLLFLRKILHLNKWSFILTLQCLRETALQLHKVHSARMRDESPESGNGKAQWVGTLQWVLSNRKRHQDLWKEDCRLTFSKTSFTAPTLSWRYFTFNVWNLLPKDAVDARLARVALDELCSRQDSWIDGSLFWPSMAIFL